MFLSDTIPPPRPDSPNGLSRNPAGTDDIPFTKPGPFMARIIRFSEVWWEADVPAGQRVYRVLPGTDGSIPRIRISVRFENLYGRIEGRYLEQAKLRFRTNHRTTRRRRRKIDRDTRVRSSRYVDIPRSARQCYPQGRTGAAARRTNQ